MGILSVSRDPWNSLGGVVHRQPDTAGQQRVQVHLRAEIRLGQEGDPASLPFIQYIFRSTTARRESKSSSRTSAYRTLQHTGNKRLYLTRTHGK